MFFGQNHRWAKYNLLLTKGGDLGPLPCLYAWIGLGVVGLDMPKLKGPDHEIKF